MVSSKSGFTFVELMVSILVIAILAAGTLVVVRHVPGKARMAKARDEIGRFKLALELYYSDNGQFPTPEQGLNALCQEPTTEPAPKKYPEGGYLDSLEIPIDPWENNYAYFMPGRNDKGYEIVSYGRDGEPGGEGEDEDISSLEL